MVSENCKLTIQDFRGVEWRQVVEQAKSKDCFDYNSLFLAKAKEAEQTGQQKSDSVYRVLSDITSLHLRSDNHKEPFGPLVIMNGKRSAIVDDFSEHHLAVLRELVSDIDDPELRARVSDVIWVRKRDYKMAEIAIDSYLESATTLEDPHHWTHCFNRIERAFRLAAQLGEKAGHLKRVVSHIEKALDKYNGEDPLFLSEKLMALLCQHKLGDPIKYAPLAEKAARNGEQAHDWHRAQSHWQRKAEWDRIANNERARKESLVKAAETYVKLAEVSVGGNRPSHMAASSHLSKAIEAYRRIGGMNERLNELHKLLLDYQQKSLKEFGVISSPGFDLSKAIEEARETVRGKSLIDALVTLSMNFRIEKVPEFRKRVEESAKKFPLTHLMPAAIVNEKGKVIGKKPGLLTDEKDDYEKALRPHMFQEAKFGYSIDVQALIDPMRRQIDLEHYVTVDDLGQIVLNNPLIPQHREYFYAKGLLCGLQGDFLTAIHLLVPQFENSVRHLLEQQDVSTSSIDDKGIQEEYDLNKLLYLDQTKKIFGEDLLFHLQGLLVEREGANIRNRMAHGLMYPGDFYSPDCVYLWAVLLRLCCWPSIVSTYEGQKKIDQSTNAQR